MPSDGDLRYRKFKLYAPDLTHAHTYTESWRVLITKPWISTFATGNCLFVVRLLLKGVNENTSFHPAVFRKSVLILN